MTFFNWGSDSSGGGDHPTVSNNIWIYFLVTVVFTLVTLFLFWYSKSKPQRCRPSAPSRQRPGGLGQLCGGLLLGFWSLLSSVSAEMPVDVVLTPLNTILTSHSGYWRFTTEVAGQTPCYSSVNRMSVPTVTVGADDQKARDTSKPTPAPIPAMAPVDKPAFVGES